MPPPTESEALKDLAYAVYEKVLKSRRGLTYYILKKRRQFLEAAAGGFPSEDGKVFLALQKLVVLWR